jgi:diacylglycerol kinase (ATP)
MGLIRFLGGFFGYYFAIIREIFFFREKHFIISGNKMFFEGKLFLVMVTNSGTTGGGFRVSPLSSVTDGLLDLIIARPLNIFKRLQYLPKVQKGDHLHLPVVSHYAGEQFTVECSEPLPAQIDGELISSSVFRFSVLKNKFLFRY